MEMCIGESPLDTWDIATFYARVSESFHARLTIIEAPMDLVN